MAASACVGFCVAPGAMPGTGLAPRRNIDMPLIIGSMPAIGAPAPWPPIRAFMIEGFSVPPPPIIRAAIIMGIAFEASMAAAFQLNWPPTKLLLPE